MNHGADATDQVMRIALQGTEVALKLTGTGAKNVAAALYAVSKDFKTNKSGETRLTQLLKDDSPTKIFRLEEKALSEFKKYAKQYNIQYSAVKEVGAGNNMCDVIIKDKDVARVNHVLGKMDYVTVEQAEKPDQQVSHEDISPKKDSQQGKNSNTQNNKSQPNISKSKEVLDGIKNNNADVITPENYKEYLKLQSFMYGYSEKNKARIFEQKPSASVVMSRTNWRNIGRYPTKDAKAILITMPEYIDGKRTGNFVDAKAYDVSDTYGKDISKTLSYTLKNDTPDIASEISRVEASSKVTIEYVSNLETDSYYAVDDKKIYIKDSLSQQDTYKALIIEQTHVDAHLSQGDNYNRANNIMLAESTAFMVANRYGIDTSEYRFDYIPDVVNGTDGKDLSEIINPVTQSGSNVIKMADKNLEQYKPKQKQSVKEKLDTHKKGIEIGVAGTSNTKSPKINIKKEK